MLLAAATTGLVTALLFVWKDDAGFARFLARVGLRAILSGAGFLAAAYGIGARAPPCKDSGRAW